MFSLVIARAHLAPRSNAPQAPRTRRRRIVPRTSRAAASGSDFFRHDQRRRLFMSGSALETSASSTASSSRLPAMSALRGSTMVERMSQSGRLGPDTSTTQDTATCRRQPVLLMPVASFYLLFSPKIDCATSRSRCSKASANCSSSPELIPSSRPRTRHVETVRSTSASIWIAPFLSSLK